MTTYAIQIDQGCWDDIVADHKGEMMSAGCGSVEYTFPNRSLRDAALVKLRQTVVVPLDMPGENQ